MLMIATLKFVNVIDATCIPMYINANVVLSQSLLTV